MLLRFWLRSAYLTAPPHHPGHLLDVVGDGLVALERPVDHKGPGPGDGLAQQVDQAHVVARTGAQALPALAQHQAEGHVGDLHAGGDPPGHAGHGEDHLEVLRLAGIGHVGQAVGTPSMRERRAARSVVA